MAGEAPADAPAEGGHELEPGRLLGRYRIQGLLGRTAWASTYAAHADDVEVAIKLAHDGGNELRAELHTVRDALRVSPGSLDNVEEGLDPETERPFFVTALCSDPSLADLVAVCPLSADEAIGLATSLAKALAPLHESGAGHLAIKPTNVFVGPPPDHEVQVGDRGADLLRRTAKARHRWLAPEQLDETADRDDPRTDVFAMALLVFFALTGSSYWSSTDDDALADELRGPRILPSLRARDVGVELDAAFDAALLRALSVEAAARFASARAFAEALAVHGEATIGNDAKAPDRPRSAPPPAAERHLKATAKLVRFELPAGTPIVNRTVKMPRFAGPAAPATPEIPAPTGSGPVASAPAPSSARGVPRFQMSAAERGSRMSKKTSARLVALAVTAVVVALIVSFFLARR